MNNEELKRLLKQEINLDIKDCLNDIKDCEVDVLPSSVKNHLQYGKYIKYGLYGLLGISILGSSSYTAYNYVTPMTYITIEIGNNKSNLSNSLEDNFMVKIDLNSFNKVIGLECNKDIEYDCEIDHMDYTKAIPMVIDYIKEKTKDSKSLTFTVISDNEQKVFTIEDLIKDIESKTVHLSEMLEDQNSHLSIGKQRAIKLILKKTSEYNKASLEKKSLTELLNILFSL